MKAFVVAALLVVVQAQNLEMMKDLKESGLGLFKPHSRFNIDRTYPKMEDLLMKEKYDTMRVTPDIDTVDMVDTMDILREKDNLILSLEEILREPLFHDYLRIPLFRQFWEEYPTVFRRYVESPLFQKFWTVPEFKQYFRNPVLFYKYILPQVKIITERIIPTTTMTDKLWDVDTTYTTPFTTTSPWDLPFNKPEINKWNVKPTITLPELKYLLVKIMNHLKINNIEKDIFTPTTTGMWNEETLKKVIDPFTLKEKVVPVVGDWKVVDGKFLPIDTPFGVEKKNFDFETLFGKKDRKTEILKELLLKKIILNKMLAEKKIVNPEIYETLLGDRTTDLYTPFNMMPEKKINFDTLFNIFGNKKVFKPEITETLFDTDKITFTPELFDLLKKDEIVPEVYEMLLKETPIKNKFLNPEILESVFGKKIYKPEVYETLFGDIMPKVDTLNFDMTMNKPFLNNPLITRMLKNKKMYTPKIKLEKEKMLMKEILEKEMLKKEHEITYPKVYTTETEFPKMMETEKMININKPFAKVPLTYSKPIGVEEYEFKLPA
jgi:hypothetical protein